MAKPARGCRPDRTRMYCQNLTLRTRSKKLTVSDTRRNPSRCFQLPVSRPTTNNWSRHFGALGVFPPSGRDGLLRGNPDSNFLRVVDDPLRARDFASGLALHLMSRRLCAGAKPSPTPWPERIPSRASRMELAILLPPHGGESLVAQSSHRIDARRSPSGDVARDRRGGD